MRDEIRERIEAVRRGEVPEGYVVENHQLRPVEWGYDRIGEHLIAYDEYSNDTERYPLATSSRQGLMLQTDYYGDQRYDETTGGFHVVPEGYITYRHMSDDDVFKFNMNIMGTPVLVSPEYPVFTTDGNLDKTILVEYLNGMKEFRAFCSAQKKGSTRTRMYFNRLGEFSMPIPPVAEQRRIAKILDVCDRGLKLKQKLIIEKQKQKQWLVSQILRGGHRRLLCGICPFICDGDWIESKDQSDAGIRLIQTGNVGLGKFRDKENRAKFITEETFDRLHCTEVLAGDVLVSRLPDPIGRACIVPAMGVKAITAVDCTILRFNDDNLARYFVHYTTSREYLDKVEALSGGSTRSRISRKEIEKLTIPIPDSIEQIIEINNRLTVADKEIELLEKEVEAQYRLKKTLMQLLLTGLVRVNA